VWQRDAGAPAQQPHPADPLRAAGAKRTREDAAATAADAAAAAVGADGAAGVDAGCAKQAKVTAPLPELQQTLNRKLQEARPSSRAACAA
jgi:hypothetical protein